MPTPEQWQEYAAQRNKYQYGKPVVGPRSPTEQPAANNVLVARPNADVDPLELTDAERSRAENNRTVVNRFFSNLLPPDGVSYNKYSGRTPMEERLSQLTAPRPDDTEVRPAPTSLEVGENVVTPKLTSLGNGYGVAGANTSDRAGYSNRTYYGPSGNVIGSGISSATGRGGFSGAATDAEADRNLKARLEQDAAAHTIAASMDRGAEAMRELRAAQVANFDGYKPGMPAVPGQLASPNPLSMPGDSFQDTRGRQAKYDQAVETASTGNMREKKGAAATLTALNDLREKNLAVQAAKEKGQTGIDPVDMGKFLLDQQKFSYQQGADNNKFLLDQERFKYQQGIDKQRLALDANEVQGKQSARQLERQKYLDESRKAFASEFSFSDPKAPREQIAGVVFDISQATGVPTDVVAQFYEQAVKDLNINYAKGGPTDPMKLNELVAARVTQKYRGK